MFLRCLCGETNFTKPTVNPLKDKAPQITPSNDPSKLTSKGFESTITAEKSDLNTGNEKREEMKIEDDLIRR